MRQREKRVNKRWSVYRKRGIAFVLAVLLLMGAMPRQTVFSQETEDGKTAVTPEDASQAEAWEGIDTEQAEADSVGAEADSVGAEDTKGPEIEFLEDDSYQREIYYNKAYYGHGGSVRYVCDNQAGGQTSLKISSSNPNVIKITSDTEIIINGGAYLRKTIAYEMMGPGIADVVITTSGNSYKMRIYVVPDEMQIKSITQTAYRSITLKWDKIPGCSGYRIERTRTGTEQYQTVETVYGGEKDNAVVQADWDVSYTYRILGFVQDEIRSVDGECSIYNTQEFTVKKIGAKLTSAKVSGSSITLKWEAMAGATGYKIYRSETENGTYACVYTVKSGSTVSYQQKVSKGITYYYRLGTLYPEGESDASSAIARFIPKKGKAKTVSCGKISQQPSYGKGQYRAYSGNWASPDQTYYYQADGKLHVVCVQNNKSLKIYTMDAASMKVKSTKTIKLSYDIWGGFYQGIDGNFYVAVGYYNKKESRTKTVIKVIQYNSKWKKGKTASIKGGAGNTFEGIYSPFDAGHCRMDMQGATLYLMTSRTMFMSSDGLRHQSNISFAIDTKKMKAKEANESYSSHSFNQFVKLKDGTLYLLDHGDAYPRSIRLTAVAQYGTKEQAQTEKNLFSIKGNTGENFTGCKVGGMEVGGKNVLVCGTSQPHKKKVKGVTGYGVNLKYNVYLALYDRKTGKVNFKWLTNYNPKNSSVAVGEARMVKLADDRFAIMYSTTQKGASKLQYVVVNDSGKKIYTKTWSNVSFDGDSQPILYKGSIYWAQTGFAGGKKETTFCSIPAVY